MGKAQKFQIDTNRANGTLRKTTCRHQVDYSYLFITNAFDPYLQEINIEKNLIEDTSQFPFNIPAIREMPIIKFHIDVTFIVGENGSGKLTFIEAVTQLIVLSQEGGSKDTVQIESKIDPTLVKFTWLV